MPPWFTEVARQNPIGTARFSAVEWTDLPAFILPIYGKSLPARAGHLSLAAWAAQLGAWLLLVAAARPRGGSGSTRLNPGPAGGRLPDALLTRWLADPGPFWSLDLSVSLYLLLTTAGVFLSGLYAPAPGIKFNNEESLFGAFGKTPETLDRFGLRWFCAVAAAVASLLLAGAHSMHGLRRESARINALLCLWGCMWVYACHRIRAVTVVHDPHHSILVVDWSLFGILVALSARSLGVEEWVCSCWLRKYATTTVGMMYLNAGLSKLQNTGLDWFDGVRLRQLIKDARPSSAWPWASDTIIESTRIGWWLGMGTFVFEVLFSPLVIIGFSRGGCCRRASGHPRPGLGIVRSLWVVLALAFHFGIYLLCYPNFGTFVHTLLALVTDPFAGWECRGRRDAKPERDGGPPAADAPRTELAEAAACWWPRLRRRAPLALRGQAPRPAAPRARVPEEEPPAGGREPLSEREGASGAGGSAEALGAECKGEPVAVLRPSRLGLWGLSALLCVCIIGWVYVEVVYPNKDLHPVIPFSSMQMFSVYSTPSQRASATVVAEFVNTRREPMEVWFMGGGNQQYKIAALRPGERKHVKTTAGHKMHWVRPATGATLKTEVMYRGMSACVV